MCQENHPELYNFISEAIIYHPDGSKETITKQETAYPGKCIMHKPKLGPTLPVYVPDKYEEFSNPQPMINLDDSEIKEYLQINIEVLTRIVDENQVQVIHANHAVLMSVVAQQVAQKREIPYAIMPHGSAIEYAVKKDMRFFNYAGHAFDDAQRIYVIGKEIKNRVKDLFPALPGVESKMLELNLGVNTSLFKPVNVKDRKDKISELCRLLIGVQRGKINLLSQNMHNGLKAGISKQELQNLIHSSASYNAKLTDENTEGKLQMIDWDNDKIMLFVGRIIASKGLHSIVAALPEILAAEPNTHLIVVGHGPQREPMEALIWALQNGHRDLVLNIVEWGNELENGGEESWQEMQLYIDFLKKTNELDNYFSKAKKYIDKHTVTFTGYLTHKELCWLFPACDVAIFPSVVAEAGPLVFLEAMASGCFPVGTYFAGMAASIDSVSQAVPPDILDLMKLSPSADQTVLDIISKVKKALYVDRNYREKLRDIAIEKYDWQNISKKFASDLRQLRS
jgi:glycosyltransferase involved in cell wall biosynthesis